MKYLLRTAAAAALCLCLTANPSVYASPNTKKSPIKSIPKILSKVEVSEESKSVVEIHCCDVNGNELGSGSGFVVSKDGEVITNYHVIDLVNKLTVTTSDDKKYDVAGIEVYDTKKDLAVLKLKGAQDLKPIKLGDSNSLKLGEDVVTIGYPLGMKVTVAFGNVSSINTPGAGYREKRKDIQITAPISRGNSGGPLLDMYGNAVGINYSTMVSGQNMNYSIPINEVKEMLGKNTLMQPEDVIKKVYATMTNEDYCEYLYWNYPDYVSGKTKFSFSDIYTENTGKTPDDVEIYINLNKDKYSDLLLTMTSGDTKPAEDWINDIYKGFHDINKGKTVHIILALRDYFDERPAGYTDDEAVFNSKLNLWDVYKIKLEYINKDNTPDFKWNK